VPPGAYVLLLRDVREIEVPAPNVTWLRSLGLDRTVAECGLAVIDDPAPFEGLARRDDRIRLYRPISDKIRAQGH
jgi:hypothetical protein